MESLPVSAYHLLLLCRLHLGMDTIPLIFHFLISSLLSSRVHSSLKDSFWTNLITTSSQFFISEALKTSFNFSLFTLQTVINLVMYVITWTNIIHFEIRSKFILMVSFTSCRASFTSCRKQLFLFISSLVSGNFSIILLSFSLVSVSFQQNFGPLYHDFCWSLWFFNKPLRDATLLLHISAGFLSLGTWNHCATELPSNIFVTLFATYVLNRWVSFLKNGSTKVESVENVVLYIGRSNSLIDRVLCRELLHSVPALGRKRFWWELVCLLPWWTNSNCLSFMNWNLRYATAPYAFSKESQKTFSSIPEIV